MLRNEWLAHLDGLVVFRGLLAAEPLRSLHAALAADEDALTGAVAAFEAALFARGTNWTEALLDAVLEEENLCLRVAAGQDAGPVLETALNSELDFLQTLGRAPLDEVFPGAAVFLPRWETTPDADYHAAYEARRAAMGQKGYGMFARHHVFALEDGHLVPVRYPDPQRLSELPGYEQEREKVIANTRALLEGRPANNVLLYGDAGTGKSSTVKAIANEFAPDGLRLIEVKKNQLYQIPALMDELAKNPLKFILFIDDLSFASNDDNFAALKAILEGGVGGRSHNVAVYATSNRRHLVKETMADRSGDDLHAMDTRQELMSLSARFGLTVTFQQPDKDRYDRILLELAKQYNVQMPSDQLFIKGAAFALRAGGRSPRVAKQFVEREKVIANTRALLEGRPANNVLLYGDAGTGKSSTVKAIANEFAPDGLRLIEVKKNQLYQIPALMDELAKNPLKFILFIDDLSFASNDDNFAALKAILEGGVGGRSHNVAVYATSNRRHLVKETMADRSGDDLHAMDTRQELMSLSARFGLTVTFQQPDKDRYDRILLELAKQYNVQMPSDQLFIKGAAFALRAGGRSPRVAKQFVELLAAGVKV